MQERRGYRCKLVHLGELTTIYQSEAVQVCHQQVVGVHVNFEFVQHFFPRYGPEDLNLWYPAGLHFPLGDVVHKVQDLGFGDGALARRAAQRLRSSLSSSIAELCRRGISILPGTGCGLRRAALSSLRLSAMVSMMFSDCLPKNLFAMRLPALSAVGPHNRFAMSVTASLLAWATPSIRPIPVIVEGSITCPRATIRWLRPSGQRRPSLLCSESVPAGPLALPSACARA